MTQSWKAFACGFFDRIANLYKALSEMIFTSRPPMIFIAFSEGSMYLDLRVSVMLGSSRTRATSAATNHGWSSIETTRMVEVLAII